MACRNKKKFYQDHPIKNWPRVTIQLPIFNERYVVERVIKSVCRFDYPKELLEIQILDDSTDDTVDIAKALAKQMKDQGFDIQYIHRDNRSGFKAGALKEGFKISKGKLFKSDISLLVKIQAFLHLTHYMVHPMMLLVVLTSISMLYSQWFFDKLSFPIMIFTLLCLATFGPSSMYLFSQKILYRDWKTRIKFLPFLMCLGIGIAVNNTKAVLEALLNVKSGFVRTPKYGIKRHKDSWHGKHYSIPLSAISILEFF